MLHNRTLVAALLIFFAANLLALVPAGAQESADESKPPVPVESGSDGQEDEGADDELFKKLTGGADAKRESDGDPLERAIHSMREAQKRIGGRDTGAGTRQLQQEVVKNLEELIEKLKQQQSQSSSSSGASPMPQPDDQKDQGDDSAEPSESPAPDDGKTRDDKADESTDQPREAEDRIAAPLAPEIMVRDVWGHLPPATREKLLNVYGDKYLPKYDDLLRRYFQSLAEEGRGAPAMK